MINGLACPTCQGFKTLVVETRYRKSEDAVYRKRKCSKCGRRFNTKEVYSDRAMSDLDAVAASLERAARAVRRISEQR